MVKSVKNNFADDPKRASEAGKKSKRGPDMKKYLERILEEKAPAAIISQFEEKLGYKPKIKHMIEFASAALILEAIKGNVSAYKEIADRISGKSGNSISIDSDSDDQLTVTITKGFEKI